MSPSKFVKHDAIPPDELVLLQKLEEVGSSITVGYMRTFLVFELNSLA